MPSLRLGGRASEGRHDLPVVRKPKRGRQVASGRVDGRPHHRRKGVLKEDLLADDVAALLRRNPAPDEIEVAAVVRVNMLSSHSSSEAVETSSISRQFW